MRYVDLTMIILLVSAIAHGVMAAAALKRRLNQTASPALLVALLFVSLGWVVVQGIERLQTLHLIIGFDLYALARIALYLLLAYSVLYFQLTRQFQRSRGRGLLGWLVGALFLISAVFLYENPLHLTDTTLPFYGYVLVRTLTAFDLLVIGWGLFMAASIFLTLRNYHSNLSPLHRNRYKYWTLAAGLTVIAGGLALIRQPIPANLLHLTALAISLFVLLTYNLPDLRMAARRSASYAIMTLMTVAVYTGGFYATERLFKDTPGYSTLLAGVILAVALTVLFNPLLNSIQRFIVRLISGARYDSRQTLAEYSMRISNILDIEVLASVVVGLIAEALEISHGALVIVHYEPETSGGEPVTDEISGSGRYHLRSISGLGEEMPPSTLNARNPVVYYLRREHHPLTQYDIDLLPRFHTMEPSERAMLSALQMDIYVPIYAKENWIGMLALGPKVSGDRYFNEDMVFLQTLADQSAVALENARLFDDVKQRSEDNERLNAELKTANDGLARLDRAKSDFINIASHELRTPLTQVIGYNDILGEMIKAGDLPPTMGKQMTESVRKAARRLEEIVETMFDVSKLDTKTLDLLHAPVSLSSVISVAINNWSKGMDERKVTVSVRGLANLPTIIGDGKRLTQVFSNLIQNAVKSTPDGGQLRITGRVVDDSSHMLPASIAGQAALTALSASTSVGTQPVHAQVGAAIWGSGPVNAAGTSGLLSQNEATESGLIDGAAIPSISAPLSGSGSGNGTGNGAGNGASNGSGNGTGNGMGNGASYGTNGSSTGTPPASPTDNTGYANGDGGGSNAGSPDPFINDAAREGAWVEIVIADTGIGIAREELERIFEKFYRVGNVLLHSTGETKFKGAGPGLGLTIARGIIEAHGGHIWAESPGHDEETCPGSRFHVVLPIRPIINEVPAKMKANHG